MKFSKLIKKLRGKRPLLAVLVDPDKYNHQLIELANRLKVSCFLVGGSRIESGNFKQTVRQIKKISNLPVVIFPGDETQLSSEADGLFLLSLLSGRNADYLIGKHIIAAPKIRKLNLPVLSTAYLLINNGKASSTEKVTGTKALNPENKKQILHTVMAAEQIGYKAVYLEAGSGSNKQVPARLIRTIKKHTHLPLIVGGGINSKTRAIRALESGASMIVIGNALEKNIHLLKEISTCFKSAKS